MSNAAAVEERLTAVMHSWQVPIEPGCEQHLTTLISQAAERVETEGFAADPEKLRQAEDNFQQLLAEMTREAESLGLHELHEPTLFNALLRLCPIWPFC